MEVRNKFSKRLQIIKECKGSELYPEGRTQKHFQKQCDINNIMAKYRKTGVIEHVRKARAIYGDFTEYMDHAVNMDKVAKAQQAFESLPATLRNEFRNDPREMMEFIRKPENYQKCVDLGIFDPKPVQQADPVLDTLKQVAENTKPQKSNRADGE